MAEQWKTDYDRRQYTLMEDRLCQFEEGGIDLGSLIGDLGALLQCLEAAGEDWKYEFSRDWGALEIIYAVALDQVEQDESANFDAIIKEPDNQSLIREAVESLRRLVTDRLASTVSLE